jgi:hypothetical protein
MGQLVGIVKLKKLAFIVWLKGATDRQILGKRPSRLVQMNPLILTSVLIEAEALYSPSPQEMTRLPDKSRK